MLLKSSGLASLVLAIAVALPADAAEIVRDKYGVPHVYGVDVPDAFFGYGYAVAEDRLFQLEMRRRQATGQLAAVLGPTGKSTATGGTVRLVELDRQARAEYDPASLRRQYDGLADAEKALIDGYLAGVNQRIEEVLADNGKLLPPQFREVWGEGVALKALRPWTLDDMLATATNALSSFSSFTTAQQNAALLAALKKKYPTDFQKRFDTMLWTNDPYAPTTAQDNPEIRSAQLVQPDAGVRVAAGPAGATVNVVPARNDPAELAEATTTSMALLVGRSKTAGPSIQLNGPQPGWSLPSYFYTVGLHAPGYDVVGHAPVVCWRSPRATTGTLPGAARQRAATTP